MTEPIAIGDQQLRGPGMGVAHYSATLMRALNFGGIGWIPVDPGVESMKRTRPGRALRALRPWARRAACAPTGIHVPDLFREAQVFFNIHHRLMQVRCEGPPGIVHWTYPVPIQLAGWRNVYTVHDAIPLLHPELTPIRQRRHARLLAHVAAAADRLVTVSDAARRDIEAALGCRPGLVVNLGQAVDVAGCRAALPAGLRPGGYFLCCGTIEPRKNIARLLAAHHASRSTRPLVLAGPDGWQAEEIIAGAPPGTAFIRLGHVPQATLLRLIADARALLMPSLAEGFGLPVGEAMTLGTPVLTADTGALAEIAGGAALLVDPRDTMQIADAIRRLDRNDALVAALAAAGRARAPFFGQAGYSARLRAFYASVGGQSQ